MIEVQEFAFIIGIKHYLCPWWLRPRLMRRYGLWPWRLAFWRRAQQWPRMMRFAWRQLRCLFSGHRPEWRHYEYAEGKPFDSYECTKCLRRFVVTRP